MRVPFKGLNPDRATKVLVVFAYTFLLLIILGLGNPAYL